MNRLLFRQLPSVVRDAMMSRFGQERYVNSFPYLVSAGTCKTYTYYTKPRSNATAFLIEFDVKAKTSHFEIGEFEGRYNERPVDSNKTKRTLDKDKILVKGYIDASSGTNVLANIEVFFHASQTPKPIPEIVLNERERQILYCFGVLKDGYTRREALSRLGVHQTEIDALVVKGVLKQGGTNSIMTLLGEANRLPPALPGQKPIVDIW